MLLASKLIQIPGPHSRRQRLHGTQVHGFGLFE